MTTVGVPHERGKPLAQRTPHGALVQRVLLVAGVFASLVYISIDLLSAIRYAGYSIADQAISELSAIGAPTAPLWAAMGPAYQILMIAFAIGILRMAGPNRALRLTGWLILAYGLSGVLWALVPMHQRGAEFSWTDLGHIVLSAATVLMIVIILGVGAFALGKRFRAYSFATILVFIMTAVLTFTRGARLAAGEPTPWLGVVERVMLYGFLCWVALLAIALMRRDRRASANPAGRLQPAGLAKPMRSRNPVVRKADLEPRSGQ